MPTTHEAAPWRCPCETCFYCDCYLAPRHEHDHFPVPVAHGGTETVPACMNCHELKDRTLPDPAAEPTINVARVAAILGIGLRTAYAAVERGEIHAIRVGRCVRIPTVRFLAHYGLNPDNGEAAS
jgi:excisionase family DNA binding protein